jgi:hypothetical protein
MRANKNTLPVLGGMLCGISDEYFSLFGISVELYNMKYSNDDEYMEMK